MTSFEDQPTAVVLPLGTTATTNPWELLARGEGAVLSSVPSPGTGTSWRKAVRGSSALGEGLGTAASGTSQAVTATGQRFLLQMPSGTTDPLMKAVGGGFRGATQNAAGKFSGNVTLTPINPATLARSIGPVGIGLLALTVASEMLGGDEQARTLDEIKKGVDQLTARLEFDDDARLRTAEQTIETAHAALLDGASIPESVGLGAAMADLQTLRNRSVALLDGWERVAMQLPPQPDGGDLRERLGTVGRLGWDAFGTAVHTAYRAIALDSRRIVLTAAEAQLRNPGEPLTAFTAAVEADLDARAQEVRRMRALFIRLAGTPLELRSWSGRIVPNFVSGAALENSRTQALFAHLSAALAPQASLPATADVDTVTVDSRPDGSMQVIRPT